MTNFSKKFCARSPFKNTIDCDDRLTYLQNRSYCDDQEYQKRKNRYEGKGYKTDEDLQDENMKLNTEVIDFDRQVKGGSPTFLPGAGWFGLIDKTIGFDNLGEAVLDTFSGYRRKVDKQLANKE